MFHTIGQRKGLGIGGLKDADETPWFVAEKRIEKNQLIVAQGHDHPALFSKDLKAHSIHWIGRLPDMQSFACTARVRHRQKDRPCQVELTSDGSCNVVFDEPVRAIAPGQSVVFYDGEICLGGGVIEGVINTNT